MNLLLSIAQLAKSTYYYWVKKLDKPDKYSKIKQEITAIVKESRNSYGYRRVTLALKMKGYTINHKTVRKLMSQMGLTCQIRIKRYKSYKGTVGKIAKNVLKRNFSVDTPNKKWVTDVTEFKIKGRKIYLLIKKIALAPERQGVEEFVKQVTEEGVVVSLGHSNATLEEAQKAVEAGASVFVHAFNGMRGLNHREPGMVGALLSLEHVFSELICDGHHVHPNAAGILMEKAGHDHVALITDCMYNNKRIKLKLNGLSPVEYRKQSIK
ncbi:integrase [Enterococcus faecium]|nr:integrase [Enterococcus faecium]